MSSGIWYRGAHRRAPSTGRFVTAAVLLMAAASAAGVAAVRSSAEASVDAPSLAAPARVDPSVAAAARSGESWQRAARPSPQADPRGTTSAPCSGAAMTKASHLYIPSLCVNAPLDTVGRGRGGGMRIPADPSRVGLLTETAPWSTSGSTSRSTSRSMSGSAGSGTTLVAGHVNSSGVKGALWDLSAIQPGALVVTTDSTGRAMRWRVYAVEQIQKQPLPIRTAGPRELTIASCAGAVVHTISGGHYEDNILAHAVPEQAVKADA